MSSNRTLRSNPIPPPTNTGRELTTHPERLAFGSCFQVKEDPSQVVYLDHEHVHDPTRLPKILYDSASSILQNATYCTWILVKVGERYEVYGSETLTSTEIGSKHRDLYFDSGRPIVFAAGECLVKRTAGNVEVQFNLESGTFMKNIAYKFSEREEKPAANYYGAFMQTIWANAGATIVRFVNEPFLQSIPNILPKNLIEQYKSVGYIPYGFPSIESCNSYRMRSQMYKRVKDIFDDAKAKGYTGDFDTWLAEYAKQFPSLEALRTGMNPPMYKGGVRRKTYRRKRKMKRTRRS